MFLVFAQCSRHMNGDLENFFSGKVGYHPITTKDPSVRQESPLRHFYGLCGRKLEGIHTRCTHSGIKENDASCFFQHVSSLFVPKLYFVFRREHLLSAHSSLGLCFVFDPHRHS